MSNARSVNQPANGVTHLNTSIQRIDSPQQSEHTLPPNISGGTLVRLSPVQKEFWDNFQSRRNSKMVGPATFIQVSANDKAISPTMATKSSPQERNAIFSLPKIARK